MNDHLGYEKGDKVSEGRRGNSRNGHTEKTVQTESGAVVLRMYRKPKT